MKKTLSILAISANAFAADRCAPEEPTCYSQDSCERCYCLGPAEVIANAPVGPVTCDGDISITVAGLYWRAEQEGLEYAIDDAVVVQEINDFRQIAELNNLIDAKYLTPDFKWNFGFKLGLSYTSPCDGWDLGVLWTRYEGNASSHNETELSDNHTLIALWSAFQGFRAEVDGIPGPIAYDIRTEWKLSLDLIDIELGRQFWVSKYLSLRPHMGLRLAFIDQSLHLEHKGGDFLADNNQEQPNLNDEVDLDNDFKGVGVRGGIDTNWHLGCGWSLYGNLAVAILYGRFDVDHDELTRGAEAPFTKTRILETEDHFRASRSALDLALGIQYSALVCDCKYGITASLGWEQHLFFHQNQLWRVNRIDPPMPALLPNNHGENDHFQRRGNLSTEGITLTFQFDF